MWEKNKIQSLINKSIRYFQPHPEEEGFSLRTFNSSLSSTLKKISIVYWPCYYQNFDVHFKRE